MKTAERIYLMLIFFLTLPTAQYYASGSKQQHRPSVRMGVQRHWIWLKPHHAAEAQSACSAVDSSIPTVQQRHSSAVDSLARYFSWTGYKKPKTDRYDRTPWYCWQDT